MRNFEVTVKVSPTNSSNITEQSLSKNQNLRGSAQTPQNLNVEVIFFEALCLDFGRQLKLTEVALGTWQHRLESLKHNTTLSKYIYANACIEFKINYKGMHIQTYLEAFFNF